MAGLIQQLIENLSEQAYYYEKLVEISYAKKKIIIKNDVPELQKLTSDENILVGKLQKSDKAREGIMNDVAYVLNAGGEKLTLTTLLERLKDQKEAEHLSEIKEKLSTITKELETINGQNKVLVDNSLEYISYSVNVLKGTLAGENAFYDSMGNEINHDSRGFFDARQ